MQIIVTSASGQNGDGHGKLLAFSMNGSPLGAFSEDSRIVDPRGLRVSANRKLVYVNSGADRVLALNKQGKVEFDTGRIAGLNPGGANLGPDDRVYVGLRTEKTIAAFQPGLEGIGKLILERSTVPYLRGFAFSETSGLFIASGIGPDGRGENALLRFASDGALRDRFAQDDEVSPLDVAIGPDGNVLVSSEFPFGEQGAVTSVRLYDAKTGALIRVFRPQSDVPFCRPRGLRFGPDGNLYCVAQDTVVAFDYGSGQCLGAVVHHQRLHGQAIEFFGH